MTTHLNDLIEYVYKSLLNEEVNKAKRGSNGSNEVHLYGIRTVDKLHCNVYFGVTYRTYELRIESDDLLEGCECGCDLSNKIYYDENIMEYEATTKFEEELDQKEQGLGHKNRTKIIKKEDVEEAINKVIELLKDLKFNTYKGMFLKDNISAYIFDVFKCPNVEIVEGEECVVCYERTLTKTWCKHCVCYKCMEHIPTVKPAHGSDWEKPCPICRADMIAPSPPE